MATYRFTVSFVADPSPRVTISPDTVHVAPDELSLLTFRLVGPAGAKFPSTPIQWLEAGEPVDLPSWFAMHRHDAGHFALWDFNSAVEAISHRFQVAVYYDVDGKLYSTDPVIVNEPPSG